MTGHPTQTAPIDDVLDMMKLESMTLRDYFAAKALQALISRDGDDTAYGVDLVMGRPLLAYEYADAMIEARSAT